VHDLSYIVLVGLIVVIVVVRNIRPQRMNVTRLWLAPLVFLIVTLQVITGSLEARAWAPLVGAVSFLGGALGVPFGLLRGRLQNVRKTKNPKVLMVEPSMLALLLWVAALVVRFGLRYVLGGTGPIAPAVGDGLLAFAAVSLVASRYVLYTKFKALHAA
jgi:hypothetical protein